jgi:hypothetical protein
LLQKGDFLEQIDNLSLFWQFGNTIFFAEPFLFFKTLAKLFKIGCVMSLLTNFWLAFVPNWGHFKVLGDDRNLSIIKPQIIDKKNSVLNCCKHYLGSTCLTSFSIFFFFLVAERVFLLTGDGEEQG